MDSDMMMTTVTMILPLALAAGGLALAAAVLQERPGDEREILHRNLASRYAFVLGLATLSAAVIVQTLSHDIDPWIVAALGAMTLGKILGMAYGRLKH